MAGKASSSLAARDAPSELALITTWARRERRVRYRQTWLATYWALLYPAATLVMYGWFFSVVLHVRGDGLPYLAFAFAGIVPWTFLAGAAISASSSILQAVRTISSMSFRREVIPLGAMTSNMTELAIGAAVLAALAVVQGIGLSVTVVALLLVATVLLLWVGALCLLLATTTVFLRDVGHGGPLLLQLGFILTPVMYPTSLLPERFDWLSTINPMAVIVEATRDVVLRHVWPSWWLLAIHALAGAGALALSLAYCRSVEVRFAEVA